MALQRISTGISRLDRLLQGGYVRGRTYLISGDAGTGKTIACLQFLLQGLNQGEKAVYVTVDERPAEILDSAASLSWDLQPHIQEKNLVILDASPYFGARGGSEKGIDPQKIVADLGNYAKRLNATLLIIDPITPLILPSDATSPSEDQARSLIQLLQSQLNTTNLFTAHSAPGRDIESGIEQFLASGVLVLKNVERDGRRERTLTVKKMRGTPVEPAEYPFVLQANDGIVLTDCPARTASLGVAELPMFEYFELPKKNS
jgi:circadian clock protein KaiC